MDDVTFDVVAREELRYIEDVLSALDPDDVECNVSDGVLRIDLRDKTRIVVNAHRAARQIWMAAISTAWHFDPTPTGAWRTARSEEELRTTLAALIQTRIGVRVSFAPIDTRDAGAPPAAAHAAAAAVARDASALELLRLWAAVAWADGKLAAAEAASLRRFIVAAQLEPAPQQLAYRFLDAPVEVPREVTHWSLAVRQGVYRLACKMAVLDGNVAATERRMLARVAAALALGDAEADRIEQGVFGAPAAAPQR